MINIEQNILDKIKEWLSPTFDKETQEIIKTMMVSSPAELTECFYKNLEFGTGGMRGIMGIGTNRINKYTLGKNTQGLSNYLHTSFLQQTLKIAIAYDCRHNSATLVKIVADVFSANGITVYLFPDIRPTPTLSFAVRELHCQCGIVLTASHNPPEYNGYKVYWKDGGQLVPPQDHEIIKAIDNIMYQDIKFDANETLIHKIDATLDQAFIKMALKQTHFETLATAKNNLKIVFTPLHGTAITLVPELLSQAGYNQVHIVTEQAKPNGDFPTVKSPNPEEPEALTLALDLANTVHADIVIGTDPDADRIGIAIRNHENKMILLNGNQTMILMTRFLLEKWKEKGKIKGKEFIATTIVSTPMMMELATAYGVTCKTVLTGFKWIAKIIEDLPELTFICGGEESFGFMVGDAVRDKDAITATALICEMAAQTKEKNRTLYDELLDCYVTYGFYKEHLISLERKGIAGAREIKDMMIQLREKPVKELNHKRVIMIEDYESGYAKNILTNEKIPLTLPKSNILIYYLEDETKIAVRPSGTEPKIKFYFSVTEKITTKTAIPVVEKMLDSKIQNMITELNLNI